MSVKKKDPWYYNKCFSFWLHERDETNQNMPWYLSMWKNRFVRLIFVEIGIIMSAGLFFSWQPVASMYFGNGAYKNLCSEKEQQLQKEAIQRDSSNQFVSGCDAQSNAVNSIFAYYMGIQFLGGTVAGICVDTIGPLLTGLIGQLCVVVGCILIVFTSDTVPLYLPAALAIGGGGNFLVYAAMGLPDYFPGHEGLVTTLSVATQSGGTIVPMLLDIVFRAMPTLNLNKIIGYFALCIILPTAICYLLSLPLFRLPLNPLYNEDEEFIINDNDNPITPTNLACAPEPSSGPKPLTSDSSTAIKIKEVRSRTTCDSSLRPVRSIAPRRSIRKDLATPEFMVFLILTLVYTSEYGFYPMILRDISGDNVAKFNGYIYPTQMFFSVLYGMAVDRFGSIPIAYVLLILIGAVYALCIIANEGVQYLVTSLYVLGVTFVYCLKFTYVGEIFLPRNYGKIVGAISIASGVVMAVNVVLMRLPHRTAIFIELGSVAVSVILTTYLAVRRCRGIHYKGIPISQTMSRYDVKYDTQLSPSTTNMHEV